MKGNKNVAKIEYLRCWSDGTWDTGFMEIKGNPSMSQEALDKQVRKAAEEITFDPEPPVALMFYSFIPEDDQEG